MLLFIVDLCEVFTDILRRYFALLDHMIAPVPFLKDINKCGRSLNTRKRKSWAYSLACAVQYGKTFK